MYTPCDLLKALINGCRAWRVKGGCRPLSRQNCQFVWSGEGFIWYRKVLAHKALLAEQLEGQVPVYIVVVHNGTRQPDHISNLNPKTSEDNSETANAERRALNTHTWHFTVIISKRFLFFVVLELQWSLRLICYIFNPLNTEFGSRKRKRNVFSNISFLDRFSASTVVSMEMAKNEIFSYCLFCFWNGNWWLCWDLFINSLCFGYFRIWIQDTWSPVLPFWKAW